MSYAYLRRWPFPSFDSGGGGGSSRPPSATLRPPLTTSNSNSNSNSGGALPSASLAMDASGQLRRVGSQRIVRRSGSSSSDDDGPPKELDGDGRRSEASSVSGSPTRRLSRIPGLRPRSAVMAQEHPLASSWSLEGPAHPCFKDHIRACIAAQTDAATEQELERSRRQSHALKHCSPVSSPSIDSRRNTGGDSVMLPVDGAALANALAEAIPTSGTCVLGASTASNSIGAGRPPRHPVSLDEVAALVRMAADGPSRAALQNMSLGWLTHKSGFSRRVTPPMVHLHLGNVGCRTLEPGQALINSPRSAVVMLRAGVTVADLAMPCAMSPAASGDGSGRTAVDGAAVARRRALEELRLRRWQGLVQEYAAACADVPLADILDFCSAYDHRRPATALRIAGTSSWGGAADETAAMALPCDTAAAKYSAIYDRHVAFDATVARCKAKVETDDAAKRAAAEARIVVDERRAARRLERLRAEREQRRQTSAAAVAVKRARLTAVGRAETFRQLRLREPVLRREDEVANISAARADAVNKYRNDVVSNSLSHRVRSESPRRAASVMEEPCGRMAAGRQVPLRAASVAL